MGSKRIVILLFGIYLLGACSVDRYIPEDKALYSEATIEFEDIEATIRKQEQLEIDIQNALYVQPNKKTLGLWLTRLWIFYRFQAKHEKGIPKFLFNNFHEPPIYLEELDTILLKNIVQKQMQDHGYFHSQTKVSHSIENDRAIVNYTIRPGSVTLIDSIHRPAPSSAVDSIAHYYKGYWLEVDEPYLLNDFKEERTRLAKHIRSKGYFEFDENDIFYLIDTSNLKSSVSVYMRTKKPENDSIHRKFYIKNVNIFVQDFRALSDDTNLEQHTYSYKNYTIYDPTNYIDKKAIEQNLLINEGSLFSLQDYEFTLGRLLNLNVFQYVNLQYSKVGKDSLDVNIYLTPKDYSGMKYDLGANTSNRSFFGSSASVNFYNANSLRRAEQLTAGLTLGSELQFVNRSLVFSILDINAHVKYEIPRILSPFKTPKFRTKTVPKTVISLEEDFQFWLQYFRKNSINASFGYQWQPKPQRSFTFDPLFININDVFSTTAEFDSIILERPTTGLSYQDNLIFGSLVAYQYNTKKRRAFGHHFNYQVSFETAGNLANQVKGLFPTSFAPSIFGISVAQYVKFDFDMRYTRGFNETSSLVSRFSTGVVRAYGATEIAPFTKQYFIGGPNSLRGFRYRAVGPGSYTGSQGQNIANPIDQAGDFKLLWNTEYRFPIYSAQVLVCE